MSALIVVVRRLWWRGMAPAAIADALQIDVDVVERMLFARVSA